MRLFLSSTSSDLLYERQIVKIVAESLGHEVLGMEEFGSRSYDAWTRCERDISRSALVLLILGRRYGSQLVDFGHSYTQAEYELARTSGVPVLAFAKAGPDDYSDVPDAPLRLKEFSDDVYAEQLVARPPFENVAQLAMMVHEALSSRDLGQREAPHFHRTRRTIADPERYAVASVKREILDIEPLSAVIVDMAMIDVSVYPDGMRRRLGNKAMQIRADLRRAGVDASIINEIVAYGPSAAAISGERLRRARKARLIIALLSRASDAVRLKDLRPHAGTLIVCHSETVPEPVLLSDDEVIHRYSPKDLDSCELVGAVYKMIAPSIDDHVFGRA